MKRFTLAVFPIILGVAVLFLGQNSINNSAELEKSPYKRTAKDKRILEAIKYTSSFRKNIKTGKIEQQDYFKAVAAADKLKAASNKSAGVLSLEWESMGPDNVGGRTRAILVDPNNTNIIYVGAVGGGMWKSIDAGNNWVLSSQGLENINVASIDRAIDGTIYIGLGEGLGNSINAGTEYHSGNPGNGMYKSTDGAASWQHISSTLPIFASPADPWAEVNRIACDPNNALHMFVANGAGLVETTDGGITWSTRLNFTDQGKDVKYAADGTTIFATGDSRLFKSDDNGVNWSQVTSASGFPTSGIGRIEIATAPSNADYVYCSAAGSSGCLVGGGIFRSIDKGNTWTSIGAGGSPTFEPFSANCQGWYDNTIAVMPQNEDKIFLGGVEFWSWGANEGWTRADQNIQGFNHTNPFWIHADKHAIVFNPNNPDIMYVGTDGGIFKSVNALSEFPEPSYTFKNKDFNVTQFYSMGASFTGEMIGGSQDNGTQYLNYRSNSPRATFEVFGGDGGYCDISRIKPEVFIAASQTGNVVRSGNSGSSFGGFFDVDIDPDGDGMVGSVDPDILMTCNAGFIAYHELFERFNVTANIDSVEFVADKDYAAGSAITVLSNENEYPFIHFLTAPLLEGETINIVDKVDAKFLFGTSCGLWMTPDILNIGISSRWFRILGGSGTVIASDITPDGNTVYAGTTAGRIYRIDGLATFDYVAEYPDPALGLAAVPIGITSTELVNLPNPITGIDIDESDPTHILVSTGGYGAAANVYRSLNGSSFSEIQSNLPLMPVYDVVIDAANTDNYIIGTELGIFTSGDAGLTWSEDNFGMERVAAYRLRQFNLYADDCPVLYLGTHGRGFFRSTTLTPGGCKTTVPDQIAGVNDPSDYIGLSNFNVYPNPVKSNASVDLVLDKSAEINFMVIDMTGRVVKSFEYGTLPQGETTIDFEVDGLSAGTYAGTLIGNGKVMDSRVIIVQ